LFIQLLNPQMKSHYHQLRGNQKVKANRFHKIQINQWEEAVKHMSQKIW